MKRNRFNKGREELEGVSDTPTARQVKPLGRRDRTAWRIIHCQQLGTGPPERPNSSLVRSDVPRTGCSACSIGRSYGVNTKHPDRSAQGRTLSSHVTLLRTDGWQLSAWRQPRKTRKRREQPTSLSTADRECHCQSHLRNMLHDFLRYA